MKVLLQPVKTCLPKRFFYFKLPEAAQNKRLMDENQRDLEKSTVAEDQMILVQTHQHLKQMEIELTKQLGTVIFR